MPSITFPTLNDAKTYDWGGNYDDLSWLEIKRGGPEEHAEVLERRWDLHQWQHEPVKRISDALRNLTRGVATGEIASRAPVDEARSMAGYNLLGAATGMDPQYAARPFTVARPRSGEVLISPGPHPTEGWVQPFTVDRHHPLVKTIEKQLAVLDIPVSVFSKFRF